MFNFRNRTGKLAVPLSFGTVILVLYILSLTLSTDSSSLRPSSIQIRETGKGHIRHGPPQARLERERQRALEKSRVQRVQPVDVQDPEGSARRALMSMIWWIAQGGVFPDNWRAPSKDQLLGSGTDGMEERLDDIGISGSAIWRAGWSKDAFAHGWDETAMEELRVVVFSKVSMPVCRCSHLSSQ